MTRHGYFAVAIVAAVILSLWIYNKSKSKLNYEALTISTVTYGTFSEYIPETGIVTRDTNADISYLRVALHESHLPQINMRLKGTAIIDDTSYLTSIRFIYERVVNGLVTIDMNFLEKTPTNVKDGQEVTLRLELGDDQMRRSFLEETFTGIAAAANGYTLSRRKIDLSNGP